jgi:hypothetical protein
MGLDVGSTIPGNELALKTVNYSDQYRLVSKP